MRTQNPRLPVVCFDGIRRYERKNELSRLACFRRFDAKSDISRNEIIRWKSVGVGAVATPGKARKVKLA
ncbi:hypothetical protein [Stenotrophomonas sp. SMYL11]|uniref:hypothetical protein n=1 Tax=Stenotrophomonas sp. SMYL11 TaxID=3076042 RepID=UPI002E76F987|nr:hypothetical protein [Stenotrophomonas sp. SMYL11]